MRPREILDANLDRIIAECAAGVALPKMAAGIGVKVPTLHAFIKFKNIDRVKALSGWRQAAIAAKAKADLEREGKGPKPCEIIAARWEDILQMVADGWSYPRMGREIGVKPATINSALRLRGVTKRAAKNTPLNRDRVKNGAPRRVEPLSGEIEDAKTALRKFPFKRGNVYTMKDGRIWADKIMTVEEVLAITAPYRVVKFGAAAE